MNIDFSKYDIIHCGISGGKDSQACATWLVQDSGIPVEKIRLSFCDTGNEHEWTYEHVHQIEKWLGVEIEWIKAELDFYRLAEKKGRFPSAKARFCTEYLKMRVTQDHLLGWMREGKNILIATGVRHSESQERAKLAEFDFDTYYACDVYRPLIDWTRGKVFHYIEKQGQFPNPLYSVGAQRVGCFPCIMSRKAEIRLISDRFPERIETIFGWEKKVGGGSSFFHASTAPARFRRTTYSARGIDYKVAGIWDIVDWSHTSRGGREYDSGPQQAFDFYEDAPTCANNSGACE